MKPEQKVLVQKGFGLILVICALSSMSVLLYYYVSGSSHHIYVGVYYYVWWEKDSWKDVPDEPLLGFYGSENHTIIKEHLYLMDKLDIDFLIVSYCGWVKSHITYRNCKEVFDVAKEIDSSLKLGILLEPNDVNESANNYDFTRIHDYIYENYATQTGYFNYKGKPLLLYWNADNMTKNGQIPKDNRFTQLIVGHQPYVDWLYVTPYSGSAGDRNFTENPTNGHICVAPAYSDAHFRSENWTWNVHYEDQGYEKEWDYALGEVEKGNVDVMTVCSFNEFAERTAIEPHMRNGCSAPPDYAYNLTRSYIVKLRNLEATGITSEWYRSSGTFIVVILTLFVCTYVLKRYLARGDIGLKCFFFQPTILPAFRTSRQTP